MSDYLEAWMLELLLEDEVDDVCVSDATCIL